MGWKQVREMTWLFFLRVSSRSCLHLPVLPPQLKMPLVSSHPPERRRKAPALICTHQKQIPVVQARKHWGSTGSEGRSLLPRGGSWMLPCGERRFWPASPSSEGEGFSSPPAGAHSRLLAASSKCRVGFPTRFWLLVGLQLIFYRSFVTFSQE